LVDSKLSICYNIHIKKQKELKMTVADFIEILRTMPADARVVAHDSDWGYTTPLVEVDDDGEVVISAG
jgi:type IV secretory pathway TrbF-like protein